MLTGCMPTTPATARRSMLSTGPEETGRGQASLWTAAAAPDHRLWTTLRGPLDPSRLPTCPLPRLPAMPPATHQSQPIKGETIYSPASVADNAGDHQKALTGGPFLSIEVGHTGLMLLWSVKLRKWGGYSSPSSSPSKMGSSQPGQLPAKPRARLKSPHSWQRRSPSVRSPHREHS